jgi:hypothetical protein
MIICALMIISILSQFSFFDFFFFHFYFFRLWLARSLILSSLSPLSLSLNSLSWGIWGMILEIQGVFYRQPPNAAKTDDHMLTTFSVPPANHFSGTLSISGGSTRK